MKFLFALVMFCLMCFFAPLAMAKDKGDASQLTSECTLKNKVFCKEWQDNDGFKVTILGHKLLSSSNVPVEECVIIDEFVDKKYPYSILKCTYFNPVINESQTDYQLYYMSERTEKRNAAIRGYENIFNVSAQSLRELFVTPDLDKDGNNVIIPTWWGGYLYRETKK